jgi:hypothetical protein
MQKKAVNKIAISILTLGIIVLGISGYFLVDFFRGFEEKNVSLEILDGGYTTWDSSNKLAKIQIGRGEDNADVEGFELIFIFSDGSATYFLNESLNNNEQRVFLMNLSENSGELMRVQLVPIFKDGRRGAL